MRATLLALVIGAIAASAGAATDQTPATTGHEGSNFLYWSFDRALAQQRLAALACKQAESASIRAFACKSQEIEGQTLGRLQALAKARNVALPSDVRETEKAIYSEIEPLRGTAFDGTYIRDAVNDLGRSVLLSEDAGQHARDPLILGYVADNLPVLERRYDEARHVEAELPDTAPNPWGPTVSNDHRPTCGPVARFEGY